MKKTGIFLFVTVTLVFAAFLAGFYAGRNFNHADVQVSTLPQTAPATTLPSGSSVASKPTEPLLVNINTGSQAELERLPKIGQKLAQRIIDYRLTYGHFRTLEEIKQVEGIGDGIFDAIKNYITI